MSRGPQETTFRQYALELLNKGPKESVVSVASRVFEVKETYAKKMAWEWKNNPVCQEEMERIMLERDSNDPATKEDKLLKLKILMDEAYSMRATDKNAVENFIKLTRIDNEMQGHTKTAETEDEKVKGQNALMADLMTQLRESNKSKIKSANQEIINIP